MNSFYALSLQKRVLIAIAATIIISGAANICLSYFFAAIHGISVTEYKQTLILQDNHSQIPIIFSTLIQQALVVFVIPALILIRTFSKNGLSQTGIGQVPPIKTGLFFIATMILFIPGINLLSGINTAAASFILSPESIFFRLYQTNESLLHIILQGTGWQDLILQIMVMAAVPAIAEELFFRACLQTYMIRFLKNKHVAIITAAAIFSILHADVFNVIPRTIMGCMFGYIYYWTGNIWIPIISHFIHNAIVVIVFFLIRIHALPESAESFGMLGASISIGVASVLFVGYISYISLSQNKFCVPKS